MLISFQQLQQLRNILFNQLDENCKKSSVHWRGSVARPIQGSNNRDVWKCTDYNYIADDD